MGLDNGIRLKTRKTIEDIAEYTTVHRNEYNKDEIEYEICYWRKCWNIRSMIFQMMNKDSNAMSDDYELSIESLKKIRIGIYQLICNPDLWDGSIWTFEEMLPHLAQDLVNLSWLIDYLRNDTTAYACFYDSY